MKHNWKKVIWPTLPIVMRRCPLNGPHAAERSIDTRIRREAQAVTTD
jgi:hypothetical protein